MGNIDFHRFLAEVEDYGDSEQRDVETTKKVISAP
jgi:hypothetical protein